MTLSSLPLTSLPLTAHSERTQKFPRRSLLPLKQDSLWHITRGAVRTLTWREDGTTVALGVWGPGDIVGSILSTANPYHIECLTPVEAILLPTHSWHGATNALMEHIQRSGELLEILHCKQVDSALLRLLAWLSTRFGSQVEQGQLIDLRLTHQELAELIGASRVTITRLLNDFEKQGIIQRHQRRLIVLQGQLPFWHYEI